MKKRTMHIEGMSCNHCKMRVEQALRAVDGVAGAEVSLEKKTARSDRRRGRNRRNSRPKRWRTRGILSRPFLDFPCLYPLYFSRVEEQRGSEANGKQLPI